MIPVRQIQTLAAVLLFLVAPGMVQADIGVVRLREAQGPFIITVFTDSELARGTDSNVSVLVQRRDSNEPVLDATVNLVFTAPPDSAPERGEPWCGSPESMPLSGTATRDQSSNKLLYAIPVNWPLAGCWNLEASVWQGSDSASVACPLAVGLPTHRLTHLLPYLALPLLLVALFGTNQWLRSRGSAPGVASRSQSALQGFA